MGSKVLSILKELIESAIIKTIGDDLMKAFLIVLGVLLSIAFLVWLISFICFLMAFFEPKRKRVNNEFDLPPGKEYEPYHNRMIEWMKQTRKLKFERCSVTSFDGLTLRGKYYEYKKGAPIELMFHGYRGSAERDLCGGVQRCFKLERNVLLVDQRASGESDGHVITFGVNESKDCLSWIDFLIKRFGKGVKIILTGISMGAATVMIAAGNELPKNVVGVLADCGYTSAKDIIKKVVRGKRLPANIVYPFIKLGAKIYGGFDLEEMPPIEALKKCKVPVIFFHGDADGYVPYEMSKLNYEACLAPKKLHTVKGADHGLSYPVDSETYLSTLKTFGDKYGW